MLPVFDARLVSHHVGEQCRPYDGQRGDHRAAHVRPHQRGVAARDTDEGEQAGDYAGVIFQWTEDVPQKGWQDREEKGEGKGWDVHVDVRCYVTGEES